VDWMTRRWAPQNRVATELRPTVTFVMPKIRGLRASVSTPLGKNALSSASQRRFSHQKIISIVCTSVFEDVTGNVSEYLEGTTLYTLNGCLTKVIPRFWYI